MDIAEQLTGLGLSRKAAATYLALLKLGAATAQQIAREAKMERTAAYRILDELSAQNLVSRGIKGKRSTYYIESPQQLQQLIERKLSAAHELIPLLVALQGEQSPKPVLRYYDNFNGVKLVLTNSLTAKEKLRRDFASIEHILDHLGKRFINRQIEERAKRGIRVRSLRSATDKKKDIRSGWFLKGTNEGLLREVRYLSQDIPFCSAIFIYDNVVSVISSKREAFALEIQSEELSQALKALFDSAWSTAHPAERAK